MRDSGPARSWRTVTNDDNGNLFRMFRAPDGSVVVPDPALYSEPVKLGVDPNGLPDWTAAIGHVKPTDVLLVTPSSLRVPGPDPAIDVRRVPAGISALWSFGQLLKLGAAIEELDINPSELQVGLQPVLIGSSVTRRIFMADSLENGAGYSTWLAQKDVFERLLDAIASKTAAKFQSGTHADTCDSSCPDCLRSYDNRLLHPVLDWRLALDMIDLARGLPLSLSRWELGRQMQAAFMDSFGKTVRLHRSEFGPLPAIFNPETRRLALFGHPLWRTESEVLGSRAGLDL